LKLWVLLQHVLLLLLLRRVLLLLQACRMVSAT